MSECPRCGGEARILVAHPGTELDAAAMEYSRLKVERSPFCPPNTIYDMACPLCQIALRPVPRPPWPAAAVVSGATLGA